MIPLSCTNCSSGQLTTPGSPPSRSALFLLVQTHAAQQCCASGLADGCSALALCLRENAQLPSRITQMHYGCSVSVAKLMSRDPHQHGCLHLTASQTQTWRPLCTTFRHAYHCCCSRDAAV